jgi:hypothetical protein
MPDVIQPEFRSRIEEAAATCKQRNAETARHVTAT